MKTLLQIFNELEGFPKAKTIIINQESDLTKINPPYFMKVDLSKHKLKEKAVIEILTQEQSKKEFKNLKQRFPKNKIIIQEKIKGTEMVIGLKYDDVFGKMLMIGFGGSNIEKAKDIEFRATPITKQEIKETIKHLKNYNSIKNKNLAIDKFCELAFNISKLNFKELDLNPIFVNEKEVIVVDARGEY